MRGLPPTSTPSRRRRPRPSASARSTRSPTGTSSGPGSARAARSPSRSSSTVYPVARREIIADGSIQDLAFDVPIKKSSWVALRVLPSSHTNPIFVLVGGKPIRASRKSAEWCLKAVDQCWSQKEKAIRPAEQEEAKKAYEVARQAYRKIREESAEDDRRDAYNWSC